MITTAQEYFSNLDILQNVNQPAYALLPKNEEIYNIDIKTRTVKAPKFLSVEKDFKAETVYFSIDRFIDYMDLAQTCCVVQYNNINSKSGTRFYAVPFYDVYQLADEKKIIFPWCLDAHVAEAAGPVEFSIKFFKIGEKLNDQHEAEKVLVYSLNTLPATSQILHGFDEQQLNENDNYYLKATEFEQLSNAIFALGNTQKMKWTILDNSFNEPSITITQTQIDLNEILSKEKTV